MQTRYFSQPPAKKAKHEPLRTHPGGAQALAKRTVCRNKRRMQVNKEEQSRSTSPVTQQELSGNIPAYRPGKKEAPPMEPNSKERGF